MVALQRRRRALRRRASSRPPVISERHGVTGQRQPGSVRHHQLEVAWRSAARPFSLFLPGERFQCPHLRLASPTAHPNNDDTPSGVMPGEAQCPPSKDSTLPLHSTERRHQMTLPHHSPSRSLFVSHSCFQPSPLVDPFVPGFLLPARCRGLFVVSLPRCFCSRITRLIDSSGRE